MAPKKKPLTVGKGTSYTRPTTPGRNPRPVSAKPSEASKVRAANKTTSSGITRRPDGRRQAEGRSARQSTSTARVTQSGGGTPGSAKVTTSKAPGTLSSSAQAKAEARGKQAVKDAQVKRNARSAMKNMEGTLKAARNARLLRGGLKGNLHIAAAEAGLQAYNTGDGTLKAALKRGDYKPKQGPTQKTTTASFNKKSFNEAFKAARSSGAKEFSWRGKRYNTKKKGE
jgi:hypothetical protein